MDVNNTTDGKVTRAFQLDSVDIFLITSYCCVLLIGVIGNALVYYVFKLKRRKPRTKMETLICYLAIGDLMSCLVNSPMFIYWTITDFQKWPFGTAACVVLPSLTRMTVTFSIGIIMFITIDRYRRICHPFGKQLKQRMLWIGTAIIICLSIIFELPTMVSKEIKPSGACDVKDVHDSVYLFTCIAIRVFRDLGILLILGWTFTAIYKVLYCKERMAVLGPSVDTKKSKKAMTMLAYMTIIFIVLVYPREILQTVFMITELHPEIKEDHAFHQLNSSLKLVLMLNMICNPFIYARLHGRFRRNIVFIMKRMLCIKTNVDQTELLCDSEAEGTRFATDMTDTTSKACKFRLRRAGVERMKQKVTQQNSNMKTASV